MAKGHVYKRGKAWYGRVDAPPDPDTGKRRQKRFSAPTKKAVDEWVAKTITSIASGGFAVAEVTRLTVSEYLDKWLASTEVTLKPSSHRRYADIVKRHFNPIIGKIQLARLSPLDVQGLYAIMLSVRDWPGASCTPGVRAIAAATSLGSVIAANDTKNTPSWKSCRASEAT